MTSVDDRSVYLPGIVPLLRLLRVLAALGLVAYLVLERGGHPDSDTWQAMMIVLGLLAAGAVSLAGERLDFGRDRRMLSIAELAIDGLVAVAVAGGSSPVASGTAWVVLVVPVIEGALRFRLRGAAWTWLAVTGGYIIATFVHLGNLTDLATADELQATVRRCGILALVAAPAGALADRLARSMILERQARAKADERGNVLAVVAEAGHDLNQLDGDPRHLLPTAATDLGFGSASVYRRSSTGWVPMTAGRAHTGEVLDAAATMAAKQRVIVALDRSHATPAELAFLTLTRAEALLAVPIERQGRSSVLIVTTEPGVDPTVHQVDGLELLVDQTRNALRNRRLVDRLRQARAEIEHQAMHDPLTGVANRLLFHRLLNSALEQRTVDTDVAVLFVDLDHFKNVNDSYGHLVGDGVLEVIARRLTAVAGQDDVVARLSGDEFTVLVAGPDASERAVSTAEQICDALAQPVRLDSLAITLSASVGVARARPGSGETADSLLGRADRAMYSAKQSGRGRWSGAAGAPPAEELAS